MYDYTGSPVHDLISRTREVKDRVNRLTALRDRVESDLAAVETECDNLNRETLVLQKVGELFRSLMDKLVAGQLDSFRGIVTDGLHTIFADQDLEFLADLGIKYNKVSIDFKLRQTIQGVEIEGKPLDSFGGGPSSITSLLLRVLTLLQTGGVPVFLLDESLAAVSDEYVDATGQFLALFARKVGADILLVTHKRSFLQHAHTAYQAQDVGGRLEVSS